MRSNMMSMPSASADPAIYTKPYEVPEQYAIHVADDVYRELAENIRVECETAATYNGQKLTVKAEAERGDNLFSVELDCYIYTKRYSDEWGNHEYLDQIVPLFCIFYSYDGEGEYTTNDFDISQFYKLFKH